MSLITGSDQGYTRKLCSLTVKRHKIMPAIFVAALGIIKLENPKPSFWKRGRSPQLLELFLNDISLCQKLERTFVSRAIGMAMTLRLWL
jgi:hypothetical protein